MCNNVKRKNHIVQEGEKWNCQLKAKIIEGTTHVWWRTREKTSATTTAADNNNGSRQQYFVRQEVENKACNLVVLSVVCLWRTLNNVSALELSTGMGERANDNKNLDFIFCQIIPFAIWKWVWIMTWNKSSVWVKNKKRKK